MNYNQSYSGVSTADFNADPYQQYVALQLGEYNTEQFTYYGKVRAELNSNIKIQPLCIITISQETGLN